MSYLKRKVESIISAFEKYHKITYETQGLWDKGTDVLYREWIEENSRFICFQIKSTDDLKKIII